MIYDLASGRWLNGPTTPQSRANPGASWAAYWTRYGVICLLQPAGTTVGRPGIGGWLLRPGQAGHAPASRDAASKAQP